MTIGRWSHFPIFLGENNTWKTIHDSYVSDQGTVLGNEDAKHRAAKLYAKSQALFVQVNQASRVKHLWDPFAMVLPILERWEAVMGLTGRGTTAERRRAVAAKFAQFGFVATHQALDDKCRELVGDVFAGCYYTTPENAAATGYGATVPGGVSGPNIDYADGPWGSVVYRITVKLRQPEGMGDGTLYDMGQNLISVLHGMFPAYVKIVWARETFGFYCNESQLDFDSV